MKVYILYHSPCWDGAMAAAIVKSAMDMYPENMFDTSYIPFNYAEGLTKEFKDEVSRPCEEPRSIHLLDISFDIGNSKHKEDLLFLCELSSIHYLLLSNRAPTIDWWDHHESSRESIQWLKDNYINHNIDIVFSTEDSGAKITFKKLNFTFGETVVNYISDFDTWKFEHANTKAFIAGLRASDHGYPTLENACKVLAYDSAKIEELINQGNNELKRQEKIFQAFSRSAFGIRLAHQDFVACSYGDKASVSEFSEYLYTKYKLPSFIFSIQPKGVGLSFRSNEELGEILWAAKQFNGGGHKYAAGGFTSIEDFATLMKNSSFKFDGDNNA